MVSIFAPSPFVVYILQMTGNVECITRMGSIKTRENRISEYCYLTTRKDLFACQGIFHGKRRDVCHCQHEELNTVEALNRNGVISLPWSKLFAGELKRGFTVWALGNGKSVCTESGWIQNDSEWFYFRVTAVTFSGPFYKLYMIPITYVSDFENVHIYFTSFVTTNSNVFQVFWRDDGSILQLVM